MTMLIGQNMKIITIKKKTMDWKRKNEQPLTSQPLAASRNEVQWTTK